MPRPRRKRIVWSTTDLKLLRNLAGRKSAARIARNLGCEPVVIKSGYDTLRVGYPELIAATEFPAIDTSCHSLLELARSVHEHGYKVALTGEGADEWLAGYSWFKINRLVGFMDRVPALPLGGMLRTLVYECLVNSW